MATRVYYLYRATANTPLDNLAKWRDSAAKWDGVVIIDVSPYPVVLVDNEWGKKTNPEELHLEKLTLGLEQAQNLFADKEQFYVWMFLGSRHSITEIVPWDEYDTFFDRYVQPEAKEFAKTILDNDDLLKTMAEKVSYLIGGYRTGCEVEWGFGGYLAVDSITYAMPHIREDAQILFEIAAEDNA